MPQITAVQGDTIEFTVRLRDYNLSEYVWELAVYNPFDKEAGYVIVDKTLNSDGSYSCVIPSNITINWIVGNYDLNMKINIAENKTKIVDVQNVIYIKESFYSNPT